MSAEPKLATGASKNNGKETPRLTPPSIVYWSRIGFAVVAGAIYNLSGISGLGLAAGTIGAIGIGVLVYVASVMTVKYISVMTRVCLLVRESMSLLDWEV